MGKQQEISKDSDLRRAADNLEYFVNYVSSPWRIIWLNFVAGIFRGLGALIGASIVIALIIWLLGLLNNVPGFGEHVEKVNAMITEYVYKTDYNDEFKSLENTLQNIEGLLREQNNKPLSD